MDSKRKTDRRTLYTCKAIKESVLSLLSEKDFYQITITDICRNAEISRCTFYLHYDNISQVVDELIDDVLSQAKPLHKQLERQSDSSQKCAFPLCQLIRSNRQYQALFLSDSLQSRVVNRVRQCSAGQLAEGMITDGRLSAKEMQTLRTFQMHGCLAVCKQNLQLSDEEWTAIQCSIDRLLQLGFQSFGSQ